MVVLSSCFTGAGNLYAGEGVLSLARGFIFSGSRSVVMSLWEVDDKEGTEIIKSFYRNLKSGRHKSEALRLARLKYLNDADMLRAHPYYWSTLVNYGDDSPLYISSFTKGTLFLIAVLLAVYAFSYFKNR
jgi:CHAT domain-containing protein